MNGITPGAMLKLATPATESVPADAPSPAQGWALSQLHGATEILGDLKTIIGVFKPGQVGLQTRKQMLFDDAVALAVAIREAPIVNMEWAIESEDPVIRAFVEWQMRKHYRGMATGMAQAIPLGFQVAEKVWQPEPVELTIEDRAKGTTSTHSIPMAWTYERFKAIDPSTVTLLVDAKNDTWGGVAQRPLGRRVGQSTPKVGPERAVLWSFRKEKAWGALTGKPSLDQSYAAWWYKQAMDFLLNRYFERRSEPPYKGFYDPAGVESAEFGKEAGYAWLARQLANLKAGNAILLPNKRDREGNLVNDVSVLADDKRGDMFDARLDRLDVRIFRGQLITDRVGTAGGAGGIGTGEADVQLKTLVATLEQDRAEFLEDVVNPQVITPLVLFNFGPEAVKKSKTRMVAGGIDADTKQVLGEIVKSIMTAETMMGDGEQVSFRDMLDKIKIAERLKLPLISPSELRELKKQREAQAAERERQAREGLRAGDPSNTDGEPNDRAIADDLMRRGALDRSGNGR